jgi:hypothetical protein
VVGRLKRGEVAAAGELGPAGDGVRELGKSPDRVVAKEIRDGGLVPPWLQGRSVTGQHPSAHVAPRLRGDRGSRLKSRSPRSLMDSVVGDDELDVDVAAGGVRVGAHLVRLLGQLLRGVVVQIGQSDLEFHRKAEAAVVDLTDRNPRSDS